MTSPGRYHFTAQLDTSRFPTSGAVSLPSAVVAAGLQTRAVVAADGSAPLKGIVRGLDRHPVRLSSRLPDGVRERSEGSVFSGGPTFGPVPRGTLNTANGGHNPSLKGGSKQGSLRYQGLRVSRSPDVNVRL